MKKTLLLVVALFATISASALKVYINPGHGGWGSDDRPNATIPYPNLSATGRPDTLGFYESNTNLWKCFYLRDKLNAVGVSTKMSRTTNGTTEAEKSLSTICSETNNYAPDHFISVHSNALTDGTNINYPIILFRGLDSNEKISGSKARATATWNELVKIYTQSQFEYYTAYQSSTNVRGDDSFYRTNPTNNNGYLGALKHSYPGYLTEGYFHTYQPSRHRALNPDWCCQEGLRYARGIINYHGLTKDTKGYIMGEVKTKESSINHSLYTYNTNTTDKYKPIHGAKIMLKNSAGDVIKTNCYPYVKRKLTNQNWYTTDNHYNGIFVFENLAPGTYAYSVHASGYKDETGTLTVTANQTTYTTIYMTSGQGTEPSVGPDVTWELNGGTVSGTLPTKISSSYTIPTPVKTGYKFLGWYNTNNTSGTQYTTLSAGFKGKLYAIWQEVELTPFAYGLWHEFSADSTEMTLHFYLNAKATNVKLIFNDGEKDYVVRDYNNVKAGGYSTTISTEIFPRGKRMVWRADVTGAAVTAPTEVTTRYSLYHPSTVDVDNNPENATFGMILTNEAEQAVKTATGYLGSGYGAGIYAFDAAFKPITNGSNPGFNGGKTFTTTANHFAPRRIRISDDGRIFATAQDGSGEYLWEINPENMNEWTAVFKGYNEGYTLTDDSGNFIAGANAGFDVRGAGDSLQLLMLSASKPGAQEAVLRTHIYNLGTAKTWNKVPTKEVTGAGYLLVPTQSNAQFDKDGGVWYSQYIATATESAPGLVHINQDGVEDYKSMRNNANNAGFRFNHDFTRVLISGVSAGTANSQKATVYIPSAKDDGSLTFRADVVIDMASLGTSLNDFAWDYAGNIYAVSNSNKKIVAYAMPHAADKVVSTPVASKYAFTFSEIPTKTAVDKPDSGAALNPFAYGLWHEFLSEDSTEMKLHFRMNALATNVKLVFNDGTKDYVVRDYNSVNAGGYSTTVKIDTLPRGKQLKWRVDVMGAEVQKTGLVNNNVKVVCPTSIDIDNNPENANFGTVFFVEAKADAKDNADYANFISNVDGAGLYLLNPDGTARKMPFQTKNRYGYNGGKIVQSAQFFHGTEVDGYSPYRVRVSDDGRIFVSSLTPDGQVLYEANPLLFSATDSLDWKAQASKGWIRVISDKNDNTVMAVEKRSCSHTYCGINSLFTENTSEFIAGPNVGFDVRGAGDNLQLLMLSGCKDAIVERNDYHFYCSEYDLGQATQWTTVPSRRIFRGYVRSYDGTQVQYDKEGNVWMCQERSFYDAPSLMKFKQDGSVAYEESPRQIYRRSGAIRFNDDFTLVAIASSGTGEGGGITIYPVLENGMPDWDNGQELDLKETTHYSIKDFAWDYANNLYVAADAASGTAGQCIAVYATPHAADRVVSTPAPAACSFKLSGPYTVSVRLNDSTMGTVEGAGVYEQGATATLTAIPYAGYEFVNWEVEGETLSTNPLSLIVNSDITVVLTFKSTITTNVDNAESNGVKVEKLFRNGQLYILRDEEVHTISGKRIR